MTLDEIRVKYPTAHYAPDPECKKCKSAGEWLFTSKRGRPDPFMTACICIFVGERKFRKIATEGLAKIAREGLAELDAERGGT